MDDTIILCNRGKCPYCNEIIFSAYRHDYKNCSCGKCFIDGGRSYLRMSENLIPMHITCSKTFNSKINDMINDCKERNCNELGVVLSTLRLLYDNGIDLSLMDN